MEDARDKLIRQLQETIRQQQEVVLRQQAVIEQLGAKVTQLERQRLETRLYFERRLLEVCEPYLGGTSKRPGTCYRSG